MRRKARENAVKYIFEYLVNGSENELTYQNLKEELSEDSQVYYATIIDGVNNKFDFLKQTVSSFVTTYALDRIYKLDLSIMCVAAYEVLFTDIPEKVAVNEAVEIAKVYSTDKSPAFINGVLASILKNKVELIEKYESENNWWKSNCNLWKVVN